MNRLGHSRVAVTSIGLGTAQLGDLYGVMTAADAAAIVDAAWARGVRYFDTAPHYGLGLAERNLGAALARYPREEYVLSTKVGRLIVDGERQWDFSAAGVRRSLQESLERLGLDRVDVALVHDPEGHLPAALDEAMPELGRMRAAGSIGAVGVGAGSLHALEVFAAQADVQAVMVAGRLTVLEQPALARLVPLCRERGISILNAGVFNSGLTATAWPGDESRYEYGPAPAELLERARHIAWVAQQHGSTLPQAALKYAAREDSVASVVIGADSPAQLTESIDALEDPRDLEPLWGALGL